MTHALETPEPRVSGLAGDVVEVAAPCGRIRGRQQHGVCRFRGIPYGLAPVGERRFAPPVPAAPFAEPFTAESFGTISAQDIDPLPEAVPGTENLFYATGTLTGEDCLNLNVWAPAHAEGAAVLVYIHGGGFLCGSGTGPWFDGSAHAREHGLVVVTLNYRLGILGGLFLGDHDPARANLGLQDQLLALAWVRDNIAAFGGDPARVTISGESAGAMSVAALLFSPSAEGLFHRAIVQSGHIDTALSPDEASAARTRVLEGLHIPADAPDLLQRLREVSLLRILAVQRALGIAGRMFPTVDDGVVLDGIATATLPAWAREVDLLIGTTMEENRLFVLTGWGSEPDSTESTVARLVATAEDRDTALALYTEDPDLAADPVSLSHRMITDQAWTEPAQRFAGQHAAAGGRTYHYRLAWRSNALEGRVGAAHVVDIPFFFDNLDAPGVEELLGDRVHEAPARALAERASATIAQFVIGGDLGDSPLGHWAPFRAEDRATMVIDTHPVLERDRDAARLAFWSEHRGSPIDTMDAVEGSAA